MNILDNRTHIVGDEIYITFMDYVAKIIPISIHDVLKWCIMFAKGSGNDEFTKPICKNSLEEAVELVENYSEQILFDNLMNELKKKYDV